MSQWVFSLSTVIAGSPISMAVLLLSESQNNDNRFKHAFFEGTIADVQWDLLLPVSSKSSISAEMLHFNA